MSPGGGAERAGRIGRRMPGAQEQLLEGQPRNAGVSGPAWLGESRAGELISPTSQAETESELPEHGS